MVDPLNILKLSGGCEHPSHMPLFMQAWRSKSYTETNNTRGITLNIYTIQEVRRTTANNTSKQQGKHCIFKVLLPVAQFLLGLF